ncbi:amidohydrolase family protein [Roseovarius sp. D0-M9]|uniref:amidohydrolase family protein n=1 Tax=Roseovarius sp. D0-M9 TaxID=3127117 RepID=UPI00300F950F
MIKFDCHAHVYERIAPVTGARYVPEHPAPLEAWRALQARNDIRGGVIVQVSFLGTDNSQLLTALSGLERHRFAGVAVVDMAVPEDELARLAQGGVRAVRWNLVAGARLPDPQEGAVMRFLDALRAHGMHLELQLESARLAGYISALAALPVPVVIDHMGLPVSADPAHEPWLDALEACRDRGDIHVKLSAPYRGQADVRAHMERLLGLLGEGRMIWGSDWPHTRHEGVATYAGALRDVAGRIDDAAAVHRLYGLRAG